MYQELTKDTKSFAYARLFLSTNGAPLTNLLYSRNVSAITLAGTDPVAITTSVNHGFVTGDKVVFHNVGGTTQLNLNAYTITKTGDATFTLNGTNSSAFSAWTSGGTCQNYTLRWFTGEGDFTDYLAPASASAQNRAGSGSCVITLESGLLTTEGIYCLELGHGLCYPAVVLVRVADAPTESLTAEDVWTYAIRTLSANTNLNDPSAATIAAAVWAAAVRTLTANTNFNDPTASAIATAVWANATRVLTANTNFNDPTAEDISAAVWAETTRTLTDLTGLEVDITAPSVTDIDTYLTAQHGAGSWEGGGTAPSVEEIDAELTDNHGSGSWQTGTGSGAVACTYTTTETDGTTPISSVFVWVTSDLAGANLIASGWTDVNGEVTFHLTSGATVYVWRSKSGYNFSNPDTEVVP